MDFDFNFNTVWKNMKLGNFYMTISLEKTKNFILIVLL